MAARLGTAPPSTDRRTDRHVAVTTTDGITWTWQDLVTTFQPALAGYARSRGVRQTDDVVQDVLLTAVRRLHDFEGDTEHLRSWLFTLAYRRIADRHRRFYGSPLLLVPDHDPTPAGDAEVDADLIRSEAFDDAMMAFDILDDRARDVLHLRIVEELSPSEVAARLDLSPGNVRVIQSRALSRVRRHLENRQKTQDQTAAGLMPLLAGGTLVSFLRDLGSALPSGGTLGAWIDQVRAATATRGLGAPGATATATFLAPGGGGAIAAVTAESSAAGAAAISGVAAVSGAAAVKAGAAGLGLTLAVGLVGATVGSEASSVSGRPAPEPTGAAAPDDTTTSDTTIAGATPVEATTPDRGSASDDTTVAGSTDDTTEPRGGSSDASWERLVARVATDDLGLSTGADDSAGVSLGDLDALVSDDDLPTVPSIGDLVDLPEDPHLTAAGRLLLEPLTDTQEIVSSLGGAIVRRDVDRSALDDALSGVASGLEDTAATVTGTDGRAPSRGSAVRDVGQEVVDTLGDVRDTVGSPTRPDPTSDGDPSDPVDTVTSTVEDVTDTLADPPAVVDVADPPVETDLPVLDDVVGTDGITDDLAGDQFPLGDLLGGDAQGGDAPDDGGLLGLG